MAWWQKNIVEEKTQISSSTWDDLNFFLFHVFCLCLCVYLRAYLLCYGIFERDLVITQNLLKGLIKDFFKLKET
jgi:hypothetical protein